MKMKSIISVAIMAVFAFCACSTNEEVEVQQERMLSIKVDQSGLATRASVNGLYTTFTEGDEIGIYILDANNNIIYENLNCSLYENVWYTYIPYNSKFDNYKFFAYYPFTYDISLDQLNLTATTATDFFSEYISEFTPLEDQSELDYYMASDLMTSKGSYDSSTGTVTFTMDHEMGLAIFKVLLESGDPLSGDSHSIFREGNVYPYLMPDSDPDSDLNFFYLIVHPDNPSHNRPFQIVLDIDGAPTIIEVEKGKYVEYTKYSPGV